MYGLIRFNYVPLLKFKTLSAWKSLKSIFRNNLANKIFLIKLKYILNYPDKKIYKIIL